MTQYATDGSSLSPTTVEVSLGATARRSGSFTITDSRISSGSPVHVWQAPGPYTAKGARADEASMDGVSCVASPGSGTATVYWRSATQVRGNFKFSYLVFT